MLLTSPLSHVLSNSTLGFICNSSTASLLGNKHTGTRMGTGGFGVSSTRLAKVKHVKRPRCYSTRGATALQTASRKSLPFPLLSQLCFNHLAGPTWGRIFGGTSSWRPPTKTSQSKIAVLQQFIPSTSTDDKGTWQAGDFQILWA